MKQKNNNNRNKGQYSVVLPIPLVPNVTYVSADSILELKNQVIQKLSFRKLTSILFEDRKVKVRNLITNRIQDTVERDRLLNMTDSLKVYKGFKTVLSEDVLIHREPEYFLFFGRRIVHYIKIVIVGNIQTMLVREYKYNGVSCNLTVGHVPGEHTDSIEILLPIETNEDFILPILPICW
jgi:hypothetical protein